MSLVATSPTDLGVAVDRAPPDYAPGEPLRVTATVPSGLLTAAQIAELSVVWYTAGKGDEDLVVHEFQRASLDNLELGAPMTLSLDTVLPPGPLSYSGRAVKVCWAARLRLFLTGGKQLSCEAPLRLGSVDAAPPRDGDEPE